MTTDNNIFLNAKVTAQLIINQSREKTLEVIESAVTEACFLPSYTSVDKEKLISILVMENNIVYDDTDSILENKEHKPWLYPSGKPVKEEREIEWKFWNNYKMHLTQKGWPFKVIETMDEMTTKILMRLEDPFRKGRWDRRGMVVGDVQSGKTGNYTGLICKAADAGYSLIVILAGMHNSLRSQTQQRLDEDFIGYDSDKDGKRLQKDNRIGVGKLYPHPPVLYITTSNEKGDFSKPLPRAGIPLEIAHPKILVVKKNKSIIENLTNWALRMGKKEGHDKIRDVPLLLIDDECDNASVNTNIVPKDEDGNPDPDHEPTAINSGIRDFLNIFEQSAYVGYTATPFANILIHWKDFHPEIGRDLFPRDFIINLPKPSNYVGPEAVFGIDDDPDIGVESSMGYPLYRIIDDHIEIIPDRHDKNLDVIFLPESLKEAINSFILICASRFSRGQQNSHNSMLVHVTRFTNVQDQIYEMIKEYINTVGNRLRYGNGGSSKNIWDELKYIWEKDFIITSRSMNQLGIIQEWEEISPYILPSIEKFQIKQLNGVSGDILEYTTYRETGINVIAIGGDKLSRGLTLEGLTVSYYLRSSRMYDTLMQMGRWFGYRDGYLDLCRIYTTSDLICAYRHIALASMELRREFDYMVENNEKPEDYGLKIRSHPGALSVTSYNKMRNGTLLRVTFDGYMVQTLFIYNNESSRENNFNAVNNLVQNRRSEKITAGYRYQNIDSEDIITFLNQYQTHPRNISFRPDYLVEYIKKLNKEDELIYWTVVILSVKGAKKETKINLEGINEYLGLTLRTAFEITTEHIQFDKTLLNPSHEKLDLDEIEIQKLKKLVQYSTKKTETPQLIRKSRDHKKGLLLLYPVYGFQKDKPDVKYGTQKYPVFGYVFSFPDSGKQREVDYIVNSLYPDEMEVLY